MTRSILELKSILNKYPDDAICFAYDGESGQGITICKDENCGYIPLNGGYGPDIQDTEEPEYI